MEKSNVCLLFIFLIILTGCASHLSKYATSTRYVNAFNTHIINDSLQIHLKTPGDIQFKQNEKALKNHLKQTDCNLSGVIAYGKTTIDPYYELYFLHNPEEALAQKNKYEFVRDTVIKRNRFVIFCRSDKTEYLKSFRNDCEEIFQSISTNTES